MKQSKPDEVFANAVNKLGEMTSTQLAKLVRENHITGRPHTSYSCPMAKLLDATCGVSTRVIGVGKKYILRLYPQKGTSRYFRVPTPPSVAKFLIDFDLGKYPDLFAPPPRAIQASTKRDKRKGDRHKPGRTFAKSHKSRITTKRNLVSLLGGRGQLVNQ